MPLFILDEDVLIIIIALLTIKEAWQLGQTCRCAYSCTITHRLSDVIVPARRLHSFCTFALAEGEYRPHHLKKFKYNYDPHDMWAIPSLPQVLELADRLESLSVDHTESALGSAYSSSLHTALKSCRVLNLMALSQANGLGVLTSSVLVGMACPVSHLQLSYVWDSGYARDYCLRAMLKPFTQSLTSIDLAYSHSASLFAELHELKMDTVWSRVHTLRLTCVEPHSLAGIVKAFPNLQVLHWDIPRPVRAGDTLAHCRRLDFVSCPCAPPLSVAVRRIRLDPREGTQQSGFHDPLIIHFLRRASPVVLTCPIKIELVRSLRYLKSSLRYPCLREDADSGQLFRWDTDAMVRINLEALDVDMRLVVLSFQLKPTLQQDGHRALPIPPEILADIARKMASLRRMPTLRIFGFKDLGRSADAGCDHSSCWLRFFPGANGGLHVERMSPLEGDEAEETLLALDD